MGNAKLLPAIGVCLLAAVSGCGDGPICQSEVLLLIQTPQGVVLGDTNDDLDGVQTEVRVRSTLGEGIDVELTVLDENEDEVFTDTAATDADGDVLFEDVELPDGAATIRVAADAGECGSDEDEVVLDVAAGRDCELAFEQEPIEVDFYAPTRVFNASVDGDADEDDFQGQVIVTTAPGYEVELFVTGDEESSEGTETSDDDGDATFDVTLAQGRQVLRAVCTDPSGNFASPSLATAVFVDTEAPICTMTDPASGDDIGTADDADSDAGNGLQVTLVGNVSGDDVEGEDATFMVTVGASMMTLDGTPIDAAGDTTVDVSLPLPTTPGSSTIELAATDHAENGCALSEDFDLVCSLPERGQVGGPCDDIADCGTLDSSCYVGVQGPVVFAPEGYCMQDDFSQIDGVCDDDGDCAAGTICVEWLDFSPYKSCMPACGCPGNSCPTNQACLTSFNGNRLDRAVCVPGDANAVDGDACDGFYQCDDFSECLDDTEYPNGQCARYGCTLGDDTTCNGGHCVNADPPFAGTTCVDTCTSAADCRGADGYVCYDPDGAGGSAPNYCRHPHVGDPCTSAADCGGAPFVCKGGTFPGGYCSLDNCAPPGDLAGCTDGSACYDDPLLAVDYCVDRCTGIGTQSTCRAGYVCTDTNPGPAVVGGCTRP